MPTLHTHFFSSGRGLDCPRHERREAKARASDGRRIAQDAGDTARPAQEISVREEEAEEARQIARAFWPAMRRRAARAVRCVTYTIAILLRIMYSKR